MDPQRLDPGNAPGADWLDVAGAGEDNFFATWTQWRAVTQATSAQDVWASRYVAGVGWEPAVLVEHDDVGNMTDVRVAIASVEQSVVVFRRCERHVRLVGESIRFSPGRRALATLLSLCSGKALMSEGTQEASARLRDRPPSLWIEYVSPDNMKVGFENTLSRMRQLRS